MGMIAGGLQAASGSTFVGTWSAAKTVSTVKSTIVVPSASSMVPGLVSN